MITYPHLPYLVSHKLHLSSFFSPFFLFPIAVITQALGVKATNICIVTGDAAQCVFMKEHIQCSKACMHIGIGPFVKPGELIISYSVILFFNIKTYMGEAAEMVSMSMNALENFGTGCCIRTPQGYQRATPFLVCHSSSSARAEEEAVGSEAFSQLGRLMKVI